ncbi:hypothetical protein Tco_0498087, partial [Tanacetum coccineum]
MIGASVMIGGGGIGVVVCYKGASGIVETDGGGKVVTSTVEGVSCIGVRTEGSEIANTCT